MHLTRRHLTPTVLAVLCRLAEEHGFDAAWVHRQLAQGRRDAMEIVSRWGHNAVRELRRVYEEHSGQTTHEQNRANARNQQITERRSQHNSLRGAQAEPTTMANNGEEHNMGDAPEEGGEQQITKPNKHWRRSTIQPYRQLYRQSNYWTKLQHTTAIATTNDISLQHCQKSNRKPNHRKFATSMVRTIRPEIPILS